MRHGTDRCRVDADCPDAKRTAKTATATRKPAAIAPGGSASLRARVPQRTWRRGRFRRRDEQWDADNAGHDDRRRHGRQGPAARTIKSQHAETATMHTTLAQM